MHVRIVFLSLLCSIASAAEIETGTSSLQFGATTHGLFSNEPAEEGSRDRKSIFLHEGTLRAEKGSFSSGVQFINRTGQPFQLEKKDISYEWGRLRLTLGDSHLDLGKGIALSLYRDSVFGIDNTLEGVLADSKMGYFRLSAFAGRLNAWKSPVAIFALANPLRSRNVYLAGGSGEAKLGENVLGGHYFFAVNQPLGQDFDQRWHTTGITYSRENLWEGADLYLESNYLRQEAISEFVADLPGAIGSYAALTNIFSPWILKTELKDYRGYQFEFRRPPTLEEDFIENQNIANVSAARLSMEYRFLESRSSIQGSVLAADDRDLRSSVYHGVLGTRWEWLGRSKWEAKAGYRLVAARENISHAQLKSKWPILQQQSLDVGFRKIYAPSEDRNVFDLSYSFSGNFSMGLGYEFFPQDPTREKHFVNFGANYRMADLALRGFAGKTSGGTLCSAGVCRRVPPYTGAYLDMTYSF